MNGDTLLFATVGDPVSRIRMPVVMPKVFEERGENAVWLTFHITQQNLATVTTMLRTVKNLRGVTVTMPHKAAIIPLLDKISLRAEIAGAVNMVRLEADGSLYGDIADGLGFVEGLTQNGFSTQGCVAWLCGAGGVGSAIASALCEYGAKAVSIFDVNAVRVEDLVARLTRAYPDVQVGSASTPSDSTTLAINASPIGAKDADPLPFQLTGLKKTCWIADVIMQPAETRLLKEALAHGFQVQPGAAMLDPQIPIYLDFMGMNKK